jgi:chromate transport protein ChrA
MATHRGAAVEADIATDAGPVRKTDERTLMQRLWEVTVEYSPLALITFGGPPAHIALLHDRFVVQRKWLSETLFVELFAIGSALPGPASTQLAYSVALMRDGLIPAIWSFCIWRYVLYAVIFI